MLKEYLEKKEISVYALAKTAGVPYSTLNDLSNGKVDLNNCRLGLVRAVSAALDLTIEELVEICSNDIGRIPTAYGIDVQVWVRNKSFCMDFEYEGRNIELELCRVNEDTKYYIRQIAQWRAERYIRERRMEAVEWNAF